MSRLFDPFPPPDSPFGPPAFNPYPRGSTVLPSAYGFGQPGGTLDAVIGTALPLVSEYLARQYGGFGFTFGGDRGVLDSYLARQTMVRRMEAMGAASAADTTALTDTFRGIGALVGQDPLDPAFAAATSRMANDFRPLLPFIATAMPGVLSRALGPQGSRTDAVIPLTDAARYLMDARGRIGGLDVGELTNVVSDQLHGRGGPDDPFRVERNTGFGGDRSFDVVREFARRGMVSGGSPRDVGDQVKRLFEQYGAALATVRDIFGDAGDPNAPAAKLFQGLEALARSSGRYDQAGLAAYAAQYRATFGPLGRSPLSMEEAVAYEQFGTAAARAYGADPSNAGGGMFAAAAATFAYQQLGYGNTRSIELPNQQEYTQEAVRLRAAFQASSYAATAGAVLNLGRLARPDSDLARMSAALSRGETMFVDSQGRTRQFGVDLQAAELDEMAAASGLGAGAFINQMQFRRANQLAFAAAPGSGRLQAQAQQGELLWLLRWFVRSDAEARALSAHLQDADITSMTDVAQRAARDLGLNEAGATRLSQAMLAAGRFGTGDDLGLFRYRVVGDRAQGSAAWFAGLVGERAREIQDTDRTNRTTWEQRTAAFLQFLGRGRAGRQAVGAVVGGFADPDDPLQNDPIINDPTLAGLKAFIGFVSNSAVPGRTLNPLQGVGVGTVPVKIDGSSAPIPVIVVNGPYSNLRPGQTALPQSGMSSGLPQGDGAITGGFR